MAFPDASPRFSIVIPTRDRPEFVQSALKFLERQTFRDFEVVVSDNPSEQKNSCSSLRSRDWDMSVTFFNPNKDLSMVDNWNFAYEKTRGQYIAYLTDKMMLLPETLRIANEALENSEASIINWIDDYWMPAKFPNYFDSGVYIKRESNLQGQAKNFNFFEPNQALEERLASRTHRANLGASDYVRGKICFGAYKRSLCEDIVKITGQLFHPISPDYTSMIAALVLAKDAIELRDAGIVHIQTDLSNGGRVSRDDLIALSFLNSVGLTEDDFQKLPIAAVYASTENLISYDIVKMLSLTGSSLALNRSAMAAFAHLDLESREGLWSSEAARQLQWSALNSYISSKLNSRETVEITRILDEHRTYGKTSPLQKFLFTVYRASERHAPYLTSRAKSWRRSLRYLRSSDTKQYISIAALLDGLTNLGTHAPKSTISELNSVTTVTNIQAAAFKE